jgi:molybdopterin-guanine dinucleotide biosynthesis protein A
MHCGGIILCGGKSTRMGTAKALLPFGNETLLARAVRLVGEAVDPIVVVAAPEHELPPLAAGVLVARDERQGRGPLEGLRAGLAALVGRADAAFATSCDVPLVVPAFVRRMVELLEQSGDAEIAVPRDGELYHPLAAVYRTSVLRQIDGLLAADRLRPAYLFDVCRTREIPVDELRSVDAELSTLMNCNRPEDYLAALAKAGLVADEEIVRRLRNSGGKSL